MRTRGNIARALIMPQKSSLRIQLPLSSSCEVEGTDEVACLVKRPPLAEFSTTNITGSKPIAHALPSFTGIANMGVLRNIARANAPGR